jgi:hypothetical protein
MPMVTLVVAAALVVLMLLTLTILLVAAALSRIREVLPGDLALPPGIPSLERAVDSTARRSRARLWAPAVGLTHRRRSLSSVSNYRFSVVSRHTNRARRSLTVLTLFAAAVPSVLPAVARAADSDEPVRVVWAGRVFTSRAELTDWLEQRGRSYEGWAARHPKAASRIEPFDEEPLRPPVQVELSPALLTAAAVLLALAVCAFTLAWRPPTAAIHRRRVGFVFFGAGAVLAVALAFGLAI